MSIYEAFMITLTFGLLIIALMSNIKK